jgi:hypothetical protein
MNWTTEDTKLATEAIALVTAVAGGFLKLNHLRKELNGNLKQLENRFQNVEEAIYGRFRRPLEGKWDFLLDYEFYKSKEFGKCRMVGDAVFLWNRNDRRYDVTIYCKLFSEKPIIVLNVLTGQFSAGLTDKEVPKEIKFRYKERVASIPELQTGPPQIGDEFKYTDLKVDNKDDVKAISGWYESVWKNGTRGTVTFSRP